MVSRARAMVKVERVIKSCVTLEQLDVALTMLNQYSFIYCSAADTLWGVYRQKSINLQLEAQFDLDRRLTEAMRLSTRLT